MKIPMTSIRHTPAPRLLVALAGCLALCAPAAARGSVSPLPASDYSVRPVCHAPARGRAGCLALQLVAITAASRAHTHPVAITASRPITHVSAAEGSYGLRPQDLHSAYQLPGKTAESPTQTVAIVDAYNDPAAEADLKVYDEEFSLPACTTANGCFKQVNENGETGNLPFPENEVELAAAEAQCSKGVKATCEQVEEANGWREEISLDIEAAHATCQDCHLLLVEAGSPAGAGLETAVDAAVELGATEVSNSWGQPSEPLADSPVFTHRGVVITASAGDDGYLNWGQTPGGGAVGYPASSPHVVAVGGTRLALSESDAWEAESVWNGLGAGGGGCSQLFSAPQWQSSLSDWSSVGCEGKRAVADISAVADPYTGLAVYDSQLAKEEEGSAWAPVGGTSLSSPVIAAAFGLAGGAHGVSFPARTLYENELKSSASLHDILIGSNGECAKPYSPKTGLSGCTSQEEAEACSARAICLAGEGYDGPTGVGTPKGLGAFQPTGQPEIIEQAGGGSSGGGSPINVSTGGGSGGAAGGGSSAGTSPPAPPPSAGVVGPVLSGLSLTSPALSALNRVRPRVSQVGFLFTLSAAARVKVQLARRTGAGRRLRWRSLRYSLTLPGTAGPNRHRLVGRDTLPAGLYRLTLTPAHGVARAIVFQIG